MMSVLNLALEVYRPAVIPAGPPPMMVTSYSLELSVVMNLSFLASSRVPCTWAPRNAHVLKHFSADFLQSCYFTMIGVDLTSRIWEK